VTLAAVAIPRTHHADALGSERALSDASGATVATFARDAWGNLTATQGSATTPFGFAGELTDGETGFVYLRARMYDPATGRFIQRDKYPTRNRFSYVSNNPASRRDPSGHLDAYDPTLDGGACVDPACATSESGFVPYNDTTWNYAAESLGMTTYLETVAAQPVPTDQRFQDVASSLPDYYKLSFSAPIPNPITGASVGIGGDLVIDRYLNVYFGAGPVAGYPTAAGLSFTPAYLLQPNVPMPDPLSGFITTWTVTGGGGFVLGGRATLSPSASPVQWSVEPGFFTPQAGIAATFAWRLFNLGDPFR
jgi:RHS repeat-associated protein